MAVGVYISVSFRDAWRAEFRESGILDARHHSPVGKNAFHIVLGGGRYEQGARREFPEKAGDVDAGLTDCGI
jgi:hypothetical protein